jgi:hypothetical protein
VRSCVGKRIAILAVSAWSSSVTGFVILLLALPLGRLRDHYGSFDEIVLWSPRATARERHGRRKWGPTEHAPAH